MLPHPGSLISIPKNVSVHWTIRTVKVRHSSDNKKVAGGRISINVVTQPEGQKKRLLSAWGNDDATNLSGIRKKQDFRQSHEGSRIVFFSKSGTVNPQKFAISQRVLGLRIPQILANCSFSARDASQEHPASWRKMSVVNYIVVKNYSAYLRPMISYLKSNPVAHSLDDLK